MKQAKRICSVIAGVFATWTVADQAGAPQRESDQPEEPQQQQQREHECEQRPSRNELGAPIEVMAEQVSARWQP